MSRRAKRKRRKQGRHCPSCETRKPDHEFRTKRIRETCASCKRLSPEERQELKSANTVASWPNRQGVVPNQLQRKLNRFLRHPSWYVRTVAESVKAVDENSRRNLNHKAARRFPTTSFGPRPFSGNANLDFDAANASTLNQAFVNEKAGQKLSRELDYEIDHEKWMTCAIKLAAHCPKNPFASVIVDPLAERIVAQGWNRSSANPILHGEIDALMQLASVEEELPRMNLILYTTAEPCPMCQSAILWSRLGAVAFGTSIRTLKRLGWGQIEISASAICQQTDFHQCELHCGVLETQCDSLFQAVVDG